MFLKFTIFTENVLESLFSKVATLEAYKFIKKRLQHMFSCEYWELFQQIFI